MITIHQRHRQTDGTDGRQLALAIPRSARLHCSRVERGTEAESLRVLVWDGRLFQTVGLIGVRFCDGDHDDDHLCWIVLPAIGVISANHWGSQSLPLLSPPLPPSLCLSPFPPASLLSPSLIVILLRSIQAAFVSIPTGTPQHYFVSLLYLPVLINKDVL